MRDEKPFAFAGLWERWRRENDNAIESCTILTTEPNELMSTLHNRMPVILKPEDYDFWLDPAVTEKDQLLSLLRPYPADQMTAYPVSTYVNTPQNDNPQCIQPV